MSDKIREALEQCLGALEAIVEECWHGSKVDEIMLKAKAALDTPIYLNEQPESEPIGEIGLDPNGILEPQIYSDFDISMLEVGTELYAGPQLPYQERVGDWMQECFGSDISADIPERNHRFLEEALELVQSKGCSAEEAHKLVDYVFSRAAGDPPQEVGGVMVTLSALCTASGLDVVQCAEREIDRITQPETMAAIREKQKRKPPMSPLPGVYPERPREYSKPVCRGNWELGSACGSCERCEETRPSHHLSEPPRD